MFNINYVIDSGYLGAIALVSTFALLILRIPTTFSKKPFFFTDNKDVYISLLLIIIPSYLFCDAVLVFFFHISPLYNLFTALSLDKFINPAAIFSVGIFFTVFLLSFCVAWCFNFEIIFKRYSNIFFVVFVSFFRTLITFVLVANFVALIFFIIDISNDDFPIILTLLLTVYIWVVPLFGFLLSLSFILERPKKYNVAFAKNMSR